MEKLSFSGYLLAIKYWLQNDTWKFPKEYAGAIMAFKRYRDKSAK